MLSRIAFASGRLWQSPAVTGRLMAPARSFASQVEPAKKDEVAVPEQEAKFDEFMINHPPNPPVIEVHVVKTIQECAPTIPLADQLHVRFGPDMPTINDDKSPTRDLVNFPRPVRALEPEGTRLIVFPDSWFTFFYDKTGYTGPYVLTAGFVTFLISKEWLILEHEMVVGASLAVIATVILKKWGKGIGALFEAQEDYEVGLWNKYQNGTIETLTEYVRLEKEFQDSLKNQGILFDAKRENVHLQREAEYRRRLMAVHNEVKRKLDYQIATQNASKQFAQKHMVSWIIDNVVKGISGQQEKDALAKCIADLKAVAAKRANVI